MNAGDQLESERRRFLGMNVRATPAMPTEHARHDVAVASRRTSVFVLQEFKLRRYWWGLRREVGAGWATFPSVSVALARPVFAGQAVVWRRRVWRRLASTSRLLHDGVAGISEDRHVRAVLLEDRTSGLAAWFGTTHFVVGGDNAGDGRHRREIFAHDLEQLDRFLASLVRTGHPVAFQLDANVRPGSEAWPAFWRVMQKHGATFYGGRGVEYLFTIPGRTVRLEVSSDWVIRTGGAPRLYTDHEARGITFRLVTS